MKKSLFIFPILIILIAFFFYNKKSVDTFSLIELSNSCKAIVVNKQDSKKIYITLKFKNAGIFNNKNKQHGISVLLSKLWFEKIGNLSHMETIEKFNELGISDLTVTGKTDNFVISFNIVETMFEPAIDFIVSGLKHKFSENELSYAKEFIPIPVDPETSSPGEILSSKLYQCLYPKHIYGKNQTGSSETIPSITLKDINEFINSNFALDNLIIYFAGKYSKKRLNYLVDSLTEILPAKAKLNEFDKLEDIGITYQHITNKNIRDICGIMTGIRLDKLSQKEIAALCVIANAMFDESFGKLKSSDLPIQFSYTISNRKHSSVLILSAFAQKKDLEIYQKKLNNLLDTITLEQLDNINLSETYLVKKQQRGLGSLYSVSDSLASLALPLKKCEKSDYQSILQKIKDKKVRRTVTISSDELPIDLIESNKNNQEKNTDNQSQKNGKAV